LNFFTTFDGEYLNSYKLWQIMYHGYIPCEYFKRAKSNGQLVSCFIGRMGYVPTTPLEEHRPVNFEWYTTIRQCELSHFL